MKKLGITLLIACTILTACDQNLQTETPPTSNTPTEQPKPISDVPAEEQPVAAPPDCEEGCQQLPPDTGFSQSPIEPQLIANLPKWNNICEQTNQEPYCYILKPYQFADGMVYLKVSGTESFLTDIRFTSSIDKNRAMSIAQAAVNSQQPFEKTEETKDKILLYGQLLDNGEDTYYLEETELTLNAQNQVTQITSFFTSP